jgi:DNA mismatch endonuclease (patch repair protein)
MAAMPVRDTRPELAVRRELHALGLRWRAATGLTVHGRPDLAWRGARVAVFVDGCFWHCCPAHWRPPRTNTGWWTAKLTRNAGRDREVTATLTADGWTVVRVWEHEPPAAAAARIAAALLDRNAARRPGKRDPADDGPGN